MTKSELQTAIVCVVIAQVLYPTEKLIDLIGEYLQMFHNDTWGLSELMYIHICTEKLLNDAEIKELISKVA